MCRFGRVRDASCCSRAQGLFGSSGSEELATRREQRVDNLSDSPKERPLALYEVLLRLQDESAHLQVFSVEAVHLYIRALLCQVL